MDDVIYLIVLIAWVVFAFYRKSQKKDAAAREAQRRARPEGESTPFPTLEEILLGEEPVTSNETAYEPATVPSSGTYKTDGIPPVLSQTSFEREYRLRGIESVEELGRPFEMNKIEVIDIQEDDENTDRNVTEEWRARFDLRQAFIYSEILNRAYV